MTTATITRVDRTATPLIRTQVWTNTTGHRIWIITDRDRPTVMYTPPGQAIPIHPHLTHTIDPAHSNADRKLSETVDHHIAAVVALARHALLADGDYPYIANLTRDVLTSVDHPDWTWPRSAVWHLGYLLANTRDMNRMPPGMITDLATLKLIDGLCHMLTRPTSCMACPPAAARP